MCDFGITAAIIGITTGIASTVIGSVSAYNQQKAAAQEADFQAQVAKNNAVIAEDNAAKTRDTGYTEANRQRLKTVSAISSQKAGLAASGIDSSFGTSNDLTASTEYYGEMDALTTLNNANSQADAYMAQGSNYGLQSNMYSNSSKTHNSAAGWAGLGTAMSGISSVASSWYSPKSIGRS